MCKFEGNLVAWIDGELAAAEALSVAAHLRNCAPCRDRLELYRRISRDFAACYVEAAPKELPAPTGRRLSRRVAWASAVAAALVIAFLLLPRSHKSAEAPIARVTTEPPAPMPMAGQSSLLASAPATKVKRPARPLAAPPKTAATPELAAAQPLIQIAIPADTVFPPGAVPEGVAYITSVSFSPDGSFHEVRLQQ